MDIRRGMQEVRKLKRDGYTPIMLAFLIGDVLNQYSKGKKLTTSCEKPTPLGVGWIAL